MTGREKEDRAAVLGRIPVQLRRPLEAYIQDGILPTGHPELMAMLSGQISKAVKLYNERYPTARYSLYVVYDAVEAHSDLCIGHPVYVAQWHEWGGLNGRPKFGLDDGLHA